MAYAPRFQKRKAKRPVKRVPRKRSGGRASIVKIVKSVISRQAENKNYSSYGANQSITCASGSNPTFRNLVPVLSNGTTEQTRIGNSVTVKNGYIRGHVNLLPYNATTNSNPLPCYVKMWLVSYRAINTPNISATQCSSNFFQAGGDPAGFQGNMLDIDFSPNKDAWVIHSTKTVKLGGSYNVTATVNNASYFDNSPMSAPFSFQYGKKLGVLKYDADTTSPTNKNMFLIFQVVSANGADSSSQIMAEYHYTARVEFEDL